MQHKIYFKVKLQISCLHKWKKEDFSGFFNQPKSVSDNQERFPDFQNKKSFAE
jgi:hypothetical protein